MHTLYLHEIDFRVIIWSAGESVVSCAGNRIIARIVQCLQNKGLSIAVFLLNISAYPFKAGSIVSKVDGCYKLIWFMHTNVCSFTPDPWSTVDSCCGDPVSLAGGQSVHSKCTFTCCGLECSDGPNLRRKVCGVETLWQLDEPTYILKLCTVLLSGLHVLTGRHKFRLYWAQNH